MQKGDGQGGGELKISQGGGLQLRGWGFRVRSPWDTDSGSEDAEQTQEAGKENHPPPPPLAPYPSPQAPPLPAPPPPAASCCPLRRDDRPVILIGRIPGGGAEGRIGWRGQRRTGRLIGGACRGVRR